jgi:hypothetical protein
LNQKLDDRYFDLTMRVLNYAMEFIDQPGYASLRMTDILKNLLELSSKLEGVNRREFYALVKAKLSDGFTMLTQQEKTRILNELIALYIEEWRKIRKTTSLSKK